MKGTAPYRGHYRELPNGPGQLWHDAGSPIGHQGARSRAGPLGIGQELGAQIPGGGYLV